MRKYIVNLSNTWEFILVITLGFGWFILTSNVKLVFNIFQHSQTWTLKLNSSYFTNTVIYETIAFMAISYVLFVRKFRISDFDFEISFKFVGVSILLFIIARYAYGIIFIILKNFINEDSLNYLKVTYSAGILDTIGILIVNSIYEEFLLNGYLFKRLANLESNLIVLISVTLRISYHSYQGWLGLVGVSIIGLVFSIYYSKYKKLWPVVIAHGLMNLTSFYASSHMSQLTKH